jgi:hypothetical protein
MKIAILFSGRIHMFENCYQNIQKHLKFNHDIDFFLSHSPELNEDLEAFRKLFNPKFIINEPIIYFDHNKYRKYHLEQGHNTMCMLINRLRAFKLLDTFVNITNTKYDIVISYRTDITLNQDIDFNWFNILNDNTVYVPEGEDYWNGLNDQLAFGSYESMKIYLSLYNELKTELLDKGCIFHPETILKNYMYLKNINVIRIPLKYKLR